MFLLKLKNHILSIKMDKYNAFMLDKIKPLSNTLMQKAFLKFLIEKGFYERYVKTVPNILEYDQCVKSVVYPIPCSFFGKRENDFIRGVGKSTFEFVKEWKKYWLRDQKLIDTIADAFIEYAEEIHKKYPDHTYLRVIDKSILTIRLYCAGLTQQHLREIVDYPEQPILKNILSVFNIEFFKDDIISSDKFTHFISFMFIG